MEIVLEIPIKIKVTDKDLMDIISDAFEGGINYWCKSYDRHGKFAFTLYDAESDDKWSFDKDDLIRGIKQYIMNSENKWSILDIYNDEVYIETAFIDAWIADDIIQYACMGRVVFA